MIFSQCYSDREKMAFCADLSYKFIENRRILCNLCNYVSNIQNITVQFVQFSSKKVLTYDTACGII